MNGDALGFDAKFLEVGPVRDEVLALLSPPRVDMPPEEDAWNCVGTKLGQTFGQRLRRLETDRGTEWDAETLER